MTIVVIISIWLGVSVAANRYEYGGKTVVKPGQSATFDAETGERIK